MRKETTADGRTSTVHFISPWSEVHDGKLVRYIVHAERRIVRLADGSGAASSAVLATPDSRNSNPPPTALPRWLVALVTTGQLTIMLALAAVLVVALTGAARRAFRPSLARVLRAFAPAAALFAVASCAGDGSPKLPALDARGSVQTLGAADTILIHDQLGSVLAEASGQGKPNGRFAAYPYGLSRYETSKETQLYAGATRDRGVGLDLMGARFYAPDLGLWTGADPGLLNSPERGAGADFGSVNAYAYANLNPIGAKDPDGEFWHIVAGAAIGALVGGGMEAARQYMAHGKVESWGRVGAAAGGSAIAGALTAAVPAAGYAAVMGLGAASGVAGGVTTRLVESGGKSAGTLSEIAGDAVVGGLSGGVMKGGAAVVGKVAKAVAPKAAGAIGKIRSLTSEKLFQKQYKELGQAARKANPCNCFGKGTLVWTSTGLRTIEQLRVGDLVLSWSEETGEVALKPITETFETPERPMIELVAHGAAGSEAIATTTGHPFWVEGTGWVHAAELTQQDVLRSVEVALAASVLHRSPVTERGPPQVSVTRSDAESLGTVYNLTVAEFHTYFVGAAGVLVHNASPCPMTPDQRALKELVDEASQGGRKPLSRQNAESVLDWADEVKYPRRPCHAE